MEAGGVMRDIASARPITAQRRRRATSVHAILRDMAAGKKRPFDAQAFLESVGLGTRVTTYAPRKVIFSQGDPCDSVMYVHHGSVRVSVLSHSGKEAILATLGAGDFLGEGALAGHPVRLETATAMA